VERKNTETSEDCLSVASYRSAVFLRVAEGTLSVKPKASTYESGCVLGATVLVPFA